MFTITSMAQGRKKEEVHTSPWYIGKLEGGMKKGEGWKKEGREEKRESERERELGTPWSKSWTEHRKLAHCPWEPGQRKRSPTEGHFSLLQWSKHAAQTLKNQRNQIKSVSRHYHRLCYGKTGLQISFQFTSDHFKYGVFVELKIIRY